MKEQEWLHASITAEDCSFKDMSVKFCKGMQEMMSQLLEEDTWRDAVVRRMRCEFPGKDGTYRMQLRISIKTK